MSVVCLVFVVTNSRCCCCSCLVDIDVVALRDDDDDDDDDGDDDDDDYDDDDDDDDDDDAFLVCLAPHVRLGSVPIRPFISIMMSVTTCEGTATALVLVTG